MNSELKLIGASLPRKDAWDKAAGAALYTADIRLPNTRWGAVLRSPYHHAGISGIDTMQARALPGVLAVLTAREVPGDRTFGPIVADQPVLAMEEVRHIGEPVAVIVAESKRRARQAIEAIRVDYEPLPAVFDPVEALQPGSPLVHPGGNLLTSYDLLSGNPEAGFAEADLILTENFRCSGWRRHTWNPRPRSPAGIGMEH